MARPAVHPPDRVSTQVRLPKDLHARLAEIADERDTSINHLMVKAAQRYLDHLPPLP